MIGMRNATYADSTPLLHVGSSAFEDWFQAQPFATQHGIKQISRDSYAAGMGDPLVTYAATPAPAQPAQQAGQAEVDGLLREALTAMELKQRVSLWENDTDAARFRGTVAKLRAHLAGKDGE